MKAIRNFLRGLMPGMPMPVHLEHFRGRCLLHVSDTPSTFYGDLGRLVSFLRPSCLVHTGDLVDEVKLALRPGNEDLFRERLKALSRAIEVVPPGNVVFARGNHDVFDDMLTAFPGSRFFDSGGRMDLCGFDVAVGHSLEELPGPPAAFNFYGHDLTSPPEFKGAIFLNGVAGANVIMLESGLVETIPYPPYVDEARCCIRKAGL